jgi:hypothetical protein
MKCAYGALLILCLSLGACADRNVGLALGAGSRGAGAALFTDNGWLGVGPFGGVMFGLSAPLYGNGESSSSGRIVYPQAAPGTAPAAAPWHREYACPDPLTAYRLLR